MGEQQKKIIEILCCYAHEDKKLLDQLETHLKILQNQGQPIKWYNREISASREWTQVINQHIRTAHITLLLISPDFMSTPYLYSTEMTVAFDRRNSEDTYIIPI